MSAMNTPSVASKRLERTRGQVREATQRFWRFPFDVPEIRFGNDFMPFVCFAQRFAILGLLANIQRCWALLLNGIGHHRFLIQQISPKTGPASSAPGFLLSLMRSRRLISTQFPPADPLNDERLNIHFPLFFFSRLSFLVPLLGLPPILTS